MADPDGGYAASQDADVGLDDDGDYFTWTREEAAAVLSPGELEVAGAYFDIGTAGEMHHNPAKNVLYVALPVQRLAQQRGGEEAEIVRLLGAAEAKLRAARVRRPAPFVDRTRYASWNAMLASAMLHAGAVLRDSWPAEHALRTMRRLRTESPEPDAVPHTPGGASGLLEDQAQAAGAALDVYEATGDDDWLAWAEAIAGRVWRDYRDPAGGLVDRAGPAGEGLLPARIRPIEDAPTPSANGVAGLVFSRLADLTADDTWRGRAGELLRSFAGQGADLGLHGATYLMAVDRYLNPAVHLIVVGPSDDPSAAAMHEEALRTYAPRRVVQRLAGAGARALPAAVLGMLGHGIRPAGYACRGDACSPPAADPEGWRAVLRSIRPLQPDVTLSAQ
jgi:hypothetical protein